MTADWVSISGNRKKLKCTKASVLYTHIVPVHNIVARTEHCVQRTLPVQSVFFWDIIIRWTGGGGMCVCV